MAYSNKEFGLNLMFARKKAHLTQEQLADATKIDKNSIARYETGGTCPGLDKVYLMAAALGCSIDELAGLPHGDAAAGAA